MAKCKLDLDHPKFVKAYRKQITNDVAFKAGLYRLKDLVSRDHKLSGWFNQPMPKFPQHQNHIWKWDFAPEGDRSATRKGWRLMAYVHDPDAFEPINAVAFLVYDKGVQAVVPPKDLSKILKDFLSETVDIQDEEDKFRRQIDGDGQIISLCLGCGESERSIDETGIDLFEDTHQCSGELL